MAERLMDAAFGRCKGCRWLRRCVNGGFCEKENKYVPWALADVPCRSYEKAAPQEKKKDIVQHNKRR